MATNFLDSKKIVVVVIKSYSKSSTWSMIILLIALGLLPDVIWNFTLPPQTSNSDYFDNENDDIGVNQTNSNTTMDSNDLNNDASDNDRPSLSVTITNDDCTHENCKTSIGSNSSGTLHTPLFGFIPRECPHDPVPEIFPVRRCHTDEECWPRVCCYESNDLDTVGYCRLPLMPVWNHFPMARVMSPIKSAMAYWQCTPPPPPDYDFFPKTCRSTFDCFPNLCCQEMDKKVCRPPRRSLLTLITNFAQQRESWFG